MMPRILAVLFVLGLSVLPNPTAVAQTCRIDGYPYQPSWWKFYSSTKCYEIKEGKLQCRPNSLSWTTIVEVENLISDTVTFKYNEYLGTTQKSVLRNKECFILGGKGKIKIRMLGIRSPEAFRSADLEECTVGGNKKKCSEVLTGAALVYVGDKQ